MISCSINRHVESVSSPLIPPTVPPEQNGVYRLDPEQWLRVLLLNSGLPVTTNSALDGSLHSLQSGMRGRLNSPLHFPIMMTNDPSITCLASGTARGVQVEWATCATGNVAPSVASAEGEVIKGRRRNALFTAPHWESILEARQLMVSHVRLISFTSSSSSSAHD